MHNTCEDSLLAVPLIIDLAILCEICERIKVRQVGAADDTFERFHSVLSLLSYLLKAPLVPENTPVVNALAAQRQVGSSSIVFFHSFFTLRLCEEWKVSSNELFH